jgi:DNA-nicking Smr family endonuclease
MAENPDCPIKLPVTSELDLHTFRPNEIGELVPDYLRECRARGILEVRVIHGKGIGNLKRGVHAILSRMPEVESFASASALYGGLGATIVKLKPSRIPRPGEIRIECQPGVRGP